MTTRYQLALQGVYDRVADRIISPRMAFLWDEYQQWLAEHNTPDPPDVPETPVPSAEEQAVATERAAINDLYAQLKANPLIQALRQRTPADIDNWINTNVTDLASAKTVLRILAYVVALLARERLR